jgi:uncharacterized protein (DUF488 family)
VKVFTIGFTKKNAEEFFGRLKRQGLVRVIDTRLNNVSQLAGFTKRDDLKYFLKELLGIDYIHMPLLAPTKDILDSYKKGSQTWEDYEIQFNGLIESRCIETKVDKGLVDGACLLCSEPTPHRCHRRLVAEYLKNRWGGVGIEHL